MASVGQPATHCPQFQQASELTGTELSSLISNTWAIAHTSTHSPQRLHAVASTLIFAIDSYLLAAFDSSSELQWPCRQ